MTFPRRVRFHGALPTANMTRLSALVDGMVDRWARKDDLEQGGRTAPAMNSHGVGENALVDRE